MYNFFYIVTYHNNWNENEIRHKGRKLAAHMNFTEYVKEYIWWRHLDIFEVVNDID